MNWLELIKPDKTPEFFWTLAGGATILTPWIVLLLLTMAGHRRKRRDSGEERAIRIYERFSSPEFYLTVRAPVTGAVLKWLFLPEPARSRFRSAVRAAWIGMVGGSPDSVGAFTRAPAPAGDFLLDHYWTLRPAGGFSEHHALAAYLQFWAMLDALRRTRAIDAALCRSLFSQSYAVHWQFIARLREDVKQNLSNSDSEPEWIRATERLEMFFL
jgi:hypothetical protein